MKILLVNKFFFMKGGAETVFFQEREMLARCGATIIDFSMQHEKNVDSAFSDYFVSNVDYHDGKKSLLGSVKTAINFIHNSEACEKLKALITKERPEIVHFHNIYHQLTPSIIKVAKSLGCKTVLTAHDTKIACPSYTMYRDGHTCEACLQGSIWNAFKYRCQEGSLFKSALLSLEATYQSLAKNYQAVDVIVSPSEFLASIIRQKLPHNRIEVVVNGIDEHVERNGVKDGRYFLYLGRLSVEKGVATLAEAYQRSKQEMPLKVVGDGPLYNELVTHYDNIDFLGFQSGEVLHTLIKECSAVIVPSECYENCSMSVIEAMAYGKPIIGANIGGIPEQVREGVEGRLFESGNPDSLAQVMDDFAQHPELVVEFGNRARHRLENKYSLARHENTLMHLYQELLSEK
ncbi:glycosyltransferase family 4 protein [Vibrio diazotrophicus]|uniref:glycosyltransferase family 4 protein n=1 Tax=Vibrio diazotrophicus TaxID=685 RepID=UPI00142D6B61|nr:glycosyltransferase family 4 protein [Vibrio diazotrophicus]NIY91789.1 glycosyltransferase family 4 protein [Vibrio diazotrophicus]